MASITTFWRITPRPRHADLTNSMAARIRDPLWFIARQWQFGEFRGEDAASPAFVRLATVTSQIDQWRAVGQPATPLRADKPLEWLVETEPFSPDLATRVELGQEFEALLRENGAADLCPTFRQAYPLQWPPDADPARREDYDNDQETTRFLSVCQGRALDGFSLYQSIQKAQGGIPAEVPQAAAAAPAITAFLAWVADVFGAIGTDDSPCWKPDRLEYEAEVLATGPTGSAVVLSTHPDRDGNFDWFAYDLKKGAEPALPQSKIVRETVVTQPIHVRFKGMPNARWWDFESSVTDFGTIDPQKRDLAKLMVIDFMVLHGNDWYQVPLHQDLGTIRWLDYLMVHDVFGGTTAIPRADARKASEADFWTMFSTAAEDDPTGVAGFLVLPPTAASAIQESDALEEVRFVRDEMHDMVFAIEHATENGIGEPWLGHERSVVAKPGQTSQGKPADGKPPLRYQLQTTVPKNWIPFVAVALDALAERFVLERAAMLQDENKLPAEPFGRILRPPGMNPYQVEEQEVPRTGVRITRVANRSRWTNGTTHLWVARRKGPGAGEANSGLRYDLAQPNNGED